MKKIVIKNLKTFLVALLCVFSTGIACAQQDNSANPQMPSKEQLLNGIAMQERLAAMQPDSVAPVFQQALLSLNYAVMYPQDKQTDGLLDKAKTLTEKLEKMKGSDKSDIATLKGYYYTCLIVQNVPQNGPRYYQNAISYLDEALRLNPDNQIARFLKAKFQEGMKAAQ